MFGAKIIWGKFTFHNKIYAFKILPSGYEENWNNLNSIHNIYKPVTPCNCPKNIQNWSCYLKKRQHLGQSLKEPKF